MYPHLPSGRRRISKLLQAMQSQGIERAPRTAAELGLQAAAGAAEVQLPSIPVVPPAPEHEVPESLDVAEEGQEAQKAAPKAGAAPAAAAVAEAPAAGAANPSGTAAAAPAAGDTLPADQQQASVEEKKKGNACFQRHQWRQVRAVWLPYCRAPSLRISLP